MADAALVLLDGVRWRGVPVPGERVHALLAALALEPVRGVGDDRLIREVWGGESLPGAPLKALQVLVSRTRAQTDPGLLVRAGQGYRLDGHDVDLWALRREVTAARSALAAGDPAAARDACRAALAVPVPVEGSTDDGPVAEVRRAARDAVDEARELLGRALAGLGEHAEALTLLEAAVATRQGDEGLLAALLTSEAAVHGAPAALVRYERHRESVRDALGTDPGPDLQRLHAELLIRDRPVREGVLEESSRLIGREDDVVALTRMIRSSRVTSILGAGGLGKTRLAHVMGRLAEQPVVHFVELAGVTSPDGVAVEVGSVLGVREPVAARRLQRAAERNDLHTRILERIDGAPALLILDNCEHVVEAVAELVAVLVARSAQLRVLSTTRAPLALAGERVYMLPTLGSADAVDLFRERATSARPGVRLDDERIATLVERLDGLPLAIELAAAKVRVMSVDEIGRRLENRFALLRGGSREAPERHQTLLAVIDWSWNLLADDERVALRRLSAFRDGFSLTGAAAVIGTPDPVAEITALVDQSLVTVQESDSVRYRLLETVREFGRMHLVEAGDDRHADGLLRAWAVGLASDAYARLYTPDQVQVMAELRIEEGNLTDVLRRAAADQDAVTVVAVMAALAGFWTVEGNHLKVIGVAGAVEEVLRDARLPQDLEDRLREVLVVLVVNTMIFSGRSATGPLEQLQGIGPGPGPGRLSALVRVILAVNGAAIFGTPEVLEPLVEDPDPEVVRAALQWTSLMLENAGDVEGAFAAARRALSLCRDDEGPWARALLTSQLAGLAVQVGDRTGARSYAEKALGAMETLGALDDTLQLKAMLSVLEMEEGRLDAAEELLDQVAEADHSRSVFGGSMVVLCGRAELALARGRTAEGLGLYLEAAESMQHHRIPGMDPELGMAGGVTPWVLYPAAAAVAAHARAGARDAVRPTSEGLRALAVSMLRPGPGFLDYPVAGAVLYALAVWDLTGPGGSLEDRSRAVRVLVAADLFAYNRMLPSLGWEWAEQQAERCRPGEVGRQRADLAGRRASELREEVAALLEQLDP
ncbi:MAG: BTAD domain-containing putative transcriptional regulator [Nocardioidaceae bacterium]